MSQWIVLLGNRIENVVEWDGAATWLPPGGRQLVGYAGEVHIGQEWADGAPVVPPEPSVVLGPPGKV